MTDQTSFCFMHNFFFLAMAYSKRLTFLISTLFLLLSFCAAQTVMKGGYWYFDSGLAVSDIEASHYTHLYCAFADLDANTNRVTISSSNTAQFSAFTQTVQRRNPTVKTLLSIGGGGANRATFSAMASPATNRKSFIDSSIQVARRNNFHGLDLDWEHPASATDRTNLGLLLNEWRAAVANESRTSGKPPLLLSAAVAGSSFISSLDFYPIQAISNNLDWINLMVYDFYVPTNQDFRSSTHAPAPLFNPPSIGSGDAGVTEWIQKGVSAKKLALGLPFYGYSWRLLNANNHGLFAAANGAANGGDGSMGYNEIRGFISKNGTQTVFNSTAITDYCYSGTTWIGYDDTQSISRKVSYAKGRGLLGYFAWQIGADNNWALSQAVPHCIGGCLSCL